MNHVTFVFNEINLTIRARDKYDFESLIKIRDSEYLNVFGLSSLCDQRMITDDNEFIRLLILNIGLENDPNRYTIENAIRDRKYSIFGRDQAVEQEYRIKYC